jgi:alpha 1,2-mannosyltransferase
MDFISDNGGESYNLCHCRSLPIPSTSRLTITLDAVWSNFEIGDLDFWRGEAYSKFFDYLDEQGGFYYEVSLAFIR